MWLYNSLVRERFRIALPFSNRAWRSTSGNLNMKCNIARRRQIMKCCECVNIANCLSHRFWFEFDVHSLTGERNNFFSHTQCGKICVNLALMSWKCPSSWAHQLQFYSVARGFRLLQKKKKVFECFEKKFTTRNIDFDELFSLRIHKRCDFHTEKKHNSQLWELF